MGRIKSDYRGDLAAGLTAWYDTASPYFATHVGVGNIKDIGHGNTLDLHAKYHYSHIGGDTVNIHSNLNEETYIFEPVNSHRLRLGAKLSHACNESTSVYGGLTWQYEFDGDARATYNGVSGASPSLKGSSFVGELGVKVKPGHTPLTLDLSLLGWAGKQRGVTCNFVANWGF